MKEKDNTTNYSKTTTERLNNVVDYIMFKYKIKTKTKIIILVSLKSTPS